MLSHQSLLDGEIDDVARLRQDADGIKHIDQRCSDPLGDVRPAFFAHDFGDLAVNGKSFEVGERKGCGMRNHPVDCQLPVGEADGLMSLERIAGRCCFVAEGLFGDHAARKFAG